MSKQFMRLTIDIMYDSHDSDKATAYLLQLAEYTDEETGWLDNTVEVVSANMNRIQLHEVGPSFDLLQPAYCEEHMQVVNRVPAESGEADEPNDGIGDDLPEENPLGDLLE